MSSLIRHFRPVTNLGIIDACDRFDINMMLGSCWTDGRGERVKNNGNYLDKGNNHIRLGDFTLSEAHDLFGRLINLAASFSSVARVSRRCDENSYLRPRQTSNCENTSTLDFTRVNSRALLLCSFYVVCFLQTRHAIVIIDKSYFLSFGQVPL